MVSRREILDASVALPLPNRIDPIFLHPLSLRDYTGD